LTKTALEQESDDAGPGYDYGMTAVHPAVAAHPSGAVVEVWAVAGAKQQGIVGEHDGALRVKVAAPAEGGRANRAIAALLREATGAAAADLERGAHHRRKRFVLVGVSPEHVSSALEESSKR
jgi:uncharacterized protein YggU (UPF0235/DUF167 family)